MRWLLQSLLAGRCRGGGRALAATGFGVPRGRRGLRGGLRRRVAGGLYGRQAAGVPPGRRGLRGGARLARGLARLLSGRRRASGGWLWRQTGRMLRRSRRTLAPGVAGRRVSWFRGCRSRFFNSCTKEENAFQREGQGGESQRHLPRANPRGYRAPPRKDAVRGTLRLGGRPPPKPSAPSNQEKTSCPPRWRTSFKMPDPHSPTRSRPGKRTGGQKPSRPRGDSGDEMTQCDAVSWVPWPRGRE